jgi:hypothetical protein
MAYTRNTQAKQRTTGRTVGETKPRRPSYIIAEIMGDPAKVLASLRVPAGVSVAVIAVVAAAGQTPGKAGPHQVTINGEWTKPGARILQSAYDNMMSYAGVRGLSSPAKTAPAPVIDKRAFAPDARSQALLRGTKIAEADLRASGGAYDLQAVRTLMHGVSRQRIDRQVREGSLLAVPGPSNRRYYPTVQFQADGTVVKGLKAVREALPTRNPWAVLNFLVQPDDRLNGRKPIDLLRDGDINDVVDAARSMGQQGE